jgi:hypothetical protein
MNILSPRIFASSQEKNSFNKLFLTILNSIQINKKHSSKKIKKKPTKPSVKQPKYMNIFFKKKLKEKILERISGNKRFLNNFLHFKYEILAQYSSKGSCLSQNSSHLNPFKFQLKEHVNKALNQIVNWFKKYGQNFEHLTARSLKKYLRQVACPVTRDDQLKVFNNIENILQIEQN